MGVLHHERVAEGEPGRWLYGLHGIFGAGRNWGSILRRVARERPEWGALLIDLRQHGASQGFPAPHTMEAAAGDLVELAGTAPPPDVILGHSFGGKVGMLAAGLEPFRERLSQLWVIDSTPDAREPEGAAWRMLQVIRSLPEAFQTRNQLIEALGRAGFGQAIAQWMATNLHHEAGDYRWRFDTAALEELLLSFFATDAWSIIEAPPPQLTIHLVRATRGSVLDEEALARAERAAAGGQVHIHHVEGGHWLNADNPDGIVELLVRELN